MNFEEVTAVVARALARQTDLVIPESDELRGAADALAVRHRYGKRKSALASDSLEALLQVRCELLARREFAGVTVNLDAALEARSHKNAFPVVAALHALEILGDVTLPAVAKAMVDQWNIVFEPRDPQLRECADYLEDEAEYEVRVRDWLDALDDGISMLQVSERADAADEDADDSSRSGKTGPEPGHGGPELAGMSRLSSPEVVHNARNEDYRAFTRRFDEIIDADDLLDLGERETLWRQMQEQLALYVPLINPLALRLQRVLLTRQYQAIQLDQEDGVLDGDRLARLVTTPVRPLAFRRDIVSDHLDTVVTLLIDTSASMRGRSIIIAAATAAVLARSLERCGIKVEILGYTTRDWHGGQSRELWLERGQPPDPGRLNDLRHIIYKRADMSWAAARVNLCVMLKPGLLKENIDGEAVLWAHGRLAARPEKRRILVVIADGAPIDNATLSENPPHILSAHLLSVARQIERGRRTELIGIGVRRDISEFYRRSLHVPDVTALGEVVIKELARLLA